jgi:hypothetical protein
MPDAIIEYEMVEHFGGLSAYLEAPFQVAEKHRLVWIARQRAKAEQNRRDQENPGGN